MNAVLYCRVSTVEQVANLSLPTQEKACREYAAREGYEVADVFVDRGESAKTTNRPEFRRLLAHCRAHAGTVHAVIVYGLSRFSRNSADHHAIAALLRGQGIALRSVTEPIDDSPAGRFMEGICAAMAQFDNDLRSDRTKVGMKAAADQGRWVWQAPLGYRTGARAAGEPSLVLRPDQADVVRRAFEGIADSDRPVLEVCQELQAAGLCGRGGAPVSINTVHRLLRNPVYAGRLQSAGLGTDRAGDWTPLIDEATWQRAQLRFGQQTRRSIAASEFPLRRFAYCATCERPLTASWSTGKKGVRYPYYHCHKSCVSTPKRALEDAFVAFLDQLTPDDDWLKVCRSTLMVAWRGECDRAAAQRGQIEAEATRLRANLRRLDEAFLYEQVIDQATYSARRAEAQERLTLADVALSHAIDDTIDVEGALAAATYALANATALWTGSASTARKTRLQWALFPDGIVWNGQTMWNRGNALACYHFGGDHEGESRMASPMAPMWNPIRIWSTAWREFLAA